MSYKGTCHVILLAKLHDMYLYKTASFLYQPSLFKVFLRGSSLTQVSLYVSFPHLFHAILWEICIYKIGSSLIAMSGGAHYLLHLSHYLLHLSHYLLHLSHYLLFLSHLDLCSRSAYSMAYCPSSVCLVRLSTFSLSQF